VAGRGDPHPVVCPAGACQATLTVLHDLGLGEHATGEARFEVEGADLAAAVLSVIGEINRTDWGITANMALPTGGVVVGEKIHLVIEVEASPKTQ